MRHRSSASESDAGLKSSCATSLAVKEARQTEAALLRRLQTGRREPRVHLRCLLGQPCFLQDGFANRTGWKQLGLLPQSFRFLRQPLLKRTSLFKSLPHEGPPSLASRPITRNKTKRANHRNVKGPQGQPGTLWNSRNPPRLRTRKSNRPMKCLLCEDCGWVCENHPDQPWTGPRAFACGGAGAPCPRCNAATQDEPARLPKGFKPDEDR